MSTLKFDPIIAYEHYLASADGLCAIDRDLRYVTWNDALARISGVSSKEALGQKVFDLFPFLEAIGEREIHERVFNGESVLADPRPYDVPEKQRKGYFQGLYSPWRDTDGNIVGIFMSIRDVGSSIDRLLSLRDLSNELAKVSSMQTALDTTLQFLVRFTRAKRGIIALTCDDKKEMAVGSQVGMDRVVLPHERVSMDARIPLTVSAKTGKPVLVSTRAQALEFGQRYIKYLDDSGDMASASVPLIIEGETFGSLAITYETEHRFSSEEANYLQAAGNLCAQSYARARQFEREQAARARAEEADRAKTRFLANVSHELRTPMTAIVGFSELLRNTFASASESIERSKVAKLGGYSESILKHALGLTRILDDILDLSRIETGSIRIEKEVVIVQPWLNEIAQITRQLASAKPIEVQLQLDPETPRSVVTDPHRAKQVMLNLLSNAIKYTDTGSILIAASPSELSPGHPGVRFRVEDTGVGMVQTSGIYKPFEPQTSKGGRHGSGLGLAIASRLAQALDGSLQLLSSQPMVGTSFEFTLPVDSSETDAGGKKLDPASYEGPSSLEHIRRQTLRAKKILVADDDQDVLQYLKDSLLSAGAEVRIAHDGAEAIEISLVDEFDVLILDLQMPRIDGFEAAQQLRDSGFTKPIIALSAHALREYQTAALKAGFDRFLAKPIELGTLANAIIEATERAPINKS